MGYFKQIEAFVKPYLETFQSDLKYDKDMLKNYTGEFLHASRSTGTNMVLLDVRAFEIHPDDNKNTLFKKQTELHNAFLFESANSRFLHGKNGKIKEVTKEEARNIFNEFLENRLERKRANIVAIDPKMISMDLKFFIEEKGRTWKSALKEAWFNGSRSLPASLQRLRNYFSHEAIFKKIKPEMTADEIHAVLCDIWNESAIKDMRTPIVAADAVADLVKNSDKTSNCIETLK